MIALIVFVIFYYQSITKTNEKVNETLVKAERSADDEELTLIVKCMMTDGVYYNSTKSSTPLYEGETPYCSFNDTKAFNDLLEYCIEFDHHNWVVDLKKKKRAFNNDRVVGTSKIDL